MKKALIITYYFPPRGGVAVIRVQKFVKYLREFGWEPIVLTVRHNHVAFRDDRLLEELPSDLTIYHTPQPWVQKLIRYSQNKGQSRHSEQNSKNVKSSNRLRNGIYLFLRRIKNRVNEIVFLYDDYMGWRPIVLRSVKQILKDHNIDLIFTSSRPYSINVIGNTLQKKTGLPWIADFRDPWIQDKRYFNPPTPIHRLAAEREEKKTVIRAAKIISVSEPMTTYFKRQYSFLPDNKFLTIPNGFDGDHFQEVNKKNPDPDKFVITYAGSFYLHQTPIWFYQAVRQFLEENSKTRDHLRIRLVGKSQKDYEAYPYDIGIGDVIETVGFVPNDQVFHHLLNSDVLLLVLFSDPKEYDFVFSGKFFEYLPAKRPILALLNQGVCADLIARHDLGLCAGFNDIQRIKEAIAELYSQWQQGEFHFKGMSDEALTDFHRRNLTRKLASLFDEVVGNKRTERAS